MKPLKNVLQETEILAQLCFQDLSSWNVLKCSKLRHCEGRRISWPYIYIYIKERERERKKKEILLMSIEVPTLSNKILLFEIETWLLYCVESHMLH